VLIATAPDAPRRQQAAAEPAEVEQGREQVAVEGNVPHAVQELRVLRVEPGEELRRDELYAEGVAALRKAGCEGAVVPGGVEAGHPGAEAQADADREMGHRDGGDRDGGEGEAAAGRWRRRRGPLPPLAARPERRSDSRRKRPGEKRKGVEEPDGAQHLGDADQERRRENRGGEPGRGAAPARKEPGAEPDAAECRGGRDDGELRRPREVVAGAQHLALRSAA
jgi:hypothetical protein